MKLQTYDVMFYFYVVQAFIALWGASSNLDKKRYGSALAYSLSFFGMLTFIIVNELIMVISILEGLK